ncbi:MAG: lysogenization regulator HflD [SAR86 cluster bacterium]|uniref:High frequency lysogenization protein HflD homolog n=1 Tax=SAR86 cluster bacterium TaxID=2030880 RepID=A0A2A5B404_9GAMM|nr:MAG: lysogenization regulator HflD [SAR86 cluster bacterium]
MNNSAVEFSRWEYQNIALATVAQCAVLVNKLAHHGQVPQRELIASINPVLVLNPGSCKDIYPNAGAINTGLRTLQEMLSTERFRENADLIRYTLGMLVLRNKLTSNYSMQERVREGLKTIMPLEHYSQESVVGEAQVEAQHNARIQQQLTIEQLAGLYQDTISRLPYRIQVQGKMEYLKNEFVSTRIRALLLSGIRSAVLWHQLGGRRWRLVFYRKHVKETAGNIRRKLITLV